MPTIDAAIQAKILSLASAARWSLTLGLVQEFSAHCCEIDSDTIMGVQKQPVIVADLNSQLLCEQSDLEWDRDWETMS